MNVRVTSSSDSLWLGNSFINPLSITVLVDSSVPLLNNKDFIFNSSTNYLILTKSAKDLLFTVGNDSIVTNYSLTITFTTIPIRLQKEYSSPMLLSNDTTISNNDSYYTPQDNEHTAYNGNSINVTNSGGFTRGITIGSKQDVTTQSSFNLSFNGHIDSTLRFRGALSEESSAIQPEGNTQLLRDLDRIFINIDYLNMLKVSLGDMHMTSSLPSGNQTLSLFAKPIYANIERKVLGAMISAESNSVFGQFGAATTRGKYTTNYFQGDNGFQGPYRLSASNGERNILIIAGTESVYIDGVIQERGERNDYIIDYSTAEIRFQPRRIISNVSRITVDFQYTDEAYSRSLITTNGGAVFGDKTFGIHALYLREGDNQDAPRNIVLSDADRATIKSAGNNQNNSYRSGVRYVGRDSNGSASGVYVKSDTLIDTQQTFYKYSPGDTNALYSVSFSYTGKQKGNYTRVSSSQYIFVGNNAGDYDTITYLPIPSVTQLVGLQLAALLLDSSLFVTSEYTHSIFEPNRFAHGIEQGNSYIINAEYDDVLLNKALHFSLKLKERFNDAHFRGLDRIRSVESMRSYGLEDTTAFGSYFLNQEHERTAKSVFEYKNLMVSAQYGRYESFANEYQAENLTTSVLVKEDSSLLPQLSFSYTNIPTIDTDDSLSSMWNIVIAKASKSFGLSQTLTPYVLYSNTYKKSYFKDEITSNSYRLTEIQSGVAFTESGGLNGKLEFRYFSDDSIRNNSFARMSSNYQYQLQLQGSLTNEVFVRSSLSLYRKKYIDTISLRMSRGNFTNFYLSFAPRYTSSSKAIYADASIDVFSERSAKVEKVFIPTQSGYGSYKYLGDINSNNLLDPNEFELARYADQANYILITRPTDYLVPTTTNNSSLRVRLSPSYLQPSGIFSILQYISSETSLKIQRKSSDELSLSTLFRWSNTTTESDVLSEELNFQQDLFFFEFSNNGKLRLRFNERRGTQQYDLGNESYYHRMLGVQGIYFISKELHSEVNVEILTDKIQSSSLQLAKSINTQKYKSALNINYTPLFSKISNTLNLQLSIGMDKSREALKTLTYDISDQLSYLFSHNIRFGILLGVEKLTIPEEISYFEVPYSLTEGRENGLTTKWELSFDYYLGNGISSSATYSGRRISTNLLPSAVIHNGRAEIRATF